MTLSRLSDLNISDPIYRAHYYQLVMAHVKEIGNTELQSYTLKPDETYRPDLVSYRVFGTPDLEWLISLVCDVPDPAEPLPIGLEIKVPSATWVRSSMRQFMDDMGLEDA